MARYTTRAAGGLLVVAGGYIVFYRARVLVPSEGTLDRGGLTTGVETLSSQLTTAIGARPLLSAAVLIGVIGAALGYVWRHRQVDDANHAPPAVAPTRRRGG